jgi:predicted acyltransferase
MSIVFSLSTILKEQGKVAAFKRLLRRFVLLFILGIIYYGGISTGWSNVRIFGVLQRLAVTYLLAGILFIHFKPRGLIIVSTIILAAYWILNVFVPVPGTGRISITPDSNWAQYIDSIWLPGKKSGGDGTWDILGILSTFPATVSCIIGIFASFILLDERVNKHKKVYFLIGIGIALLIIGLGWSFSFPVIKKIWSSTYVLIAGGLSLMLMGLFYWLIDVLGYKKWTLIFVWIGVNPITIYMLRKLMDFNKLATYIAGGTNDFDSPDNWGYLLTMTVSMLLSLLLLRFLYNRKIFIKV